MFFANFKTTSIEESRKKASVKRWGMKFSAPNSKMISGFTMKEFLKKIEDDNIREVYFHDLNFAGSFIVQWLMNNGYFPIGIDEKDEDDKPIPLKPKSWKYICNERAGIYVINVMFKNGNKVNFIDSWKTLTSTYDELKEAAGIEFDFSGDFVFSDFTEAKQDRLLLKEIEEEIDAVIYSFVKVQAKYKKKLTRSAISINDFKEFYNKQNKSGRAYSIDFGGPVWDYRKKAFVPHNILSVEEWNYVHKSFNGGYNAWKEGIENKLWKVPNGVVYDVNSMHSSIAESHEVPYGKMLNKKPLHGNYATMLTINIGKAVKNNPKAPNLIKKNLGRYKAAVYVDTLEYEERTYWLEEWEFILRHYDIDYIIIRETYFRKKMVFDKWLVEKKEMKQNASNDVDKALIKGIQNGGIGKLAQSIKMGARVIVKDGYEVKHIKEPFIFKNYKGDEVQAFKGDRILVDCMTGELFRKISPNFQRYGKNGEFTHEVRFEDVKQRNHVGTSSYIYMLARIKLWKAIFANLDIWIYSDSDSAFFSDTPRGIPIHSTKYGFWKPQHKFDRIKVLRGKAYMFRSTAYWKNGRWVEKKYLVKKVSGLNKGGKEKLNFDNFHNGFVVHDGKDAMLSVEGGKIRYKTDYTIGEKVFI